VILALGPERRATRGILQGIARFAALHESWLFDIEPPFYERYPFCMRADHTERTLARLRGTGADGIITFILDDAMARAIPRGFPAVVIPMADLVPGHCNVVDQPYAAARMAVEHLRERGFTRFAFCGLDRSYWSRIRQESFAGQLADDGLRVELYCPRLPARPRSWRMEQRRLAKWLKALPKPIGLMAFNDERALQVAEACRLAEVVVPDEVAIVGVDNDEIICGLSNPPLSSIALNFERAGYEAAEQLRRQMTGAAPSAGEIPIRPTVVVARRSTDVLAVEDMEIAEALRFIRNHAAEAITVTDVLKEIMVSRRVLERRFQEILGRGIRREIERCHVERSCHLLIDTHWPLQRVAEQCGFSSLTHFGIAFRRVMRLSPRQYRDEHAAAGPYNPPR